MKFKGIALLVISLLLLSYTAFSMENVLFPPTSDFETAKKSLEEKIDSKVKEGHRQIVQAFGIDLDQWIQFDISDIPEVTDGAFPGIDKDAGRAFIRTYHGDVIKEYHKVGDLKPLFLINKNLNEAMIGFLHSDDTVTIVKLKRDGIAEDSQFVIAVVDRKDGSSYEK